MMPVYVDTSALAKWYMHEQFSSQVESFLQSTGTAHISSLTQVELRCLLARRRRVGDIPAELEWTIFSTFERDIADGHLVLHSVHSEHFEEALRLIGSMLREPLRSLDALHLAVLRREGLGGLATADRVMAKAAAALDLEVTLFA